MKVLLIQSRHFITPYIPFAGHDNDHIRFRCFPSSASWAVAPTSAGPFSELAACISKCISAKWRNRLAWDKQALITCYMQVFKYVIKYLSIPDCFVIDLINIFIGNKFPASSLWLFVLLLHAITYHIWVILLLQDRESEKDMMMNTISINRLD